MDASSESAGGSEASGDLKLLPTPFTVTGLPSSRFGELRKRLNSCRRCTVLSSRRWREGRTATRLSHAHPARCAVRGHDRVRRLHDRWRRDGDRCLQEEGAGIRPPDDADRRDERDCKRGARALRAARPGRAVVRHGEHRPLHRHARPGPPHRHPRHARSAGLGDQDRHARRSPGHRAAKDRRLPHVPVDEVGGRHRGSNALRQPDHHRAAARAPARRRTRSPRPGRMDDGKKLEVPPFRPATPTRTTSSSARRGEVYTALADDHRQPVRWALGQQGERAREGSSEGQGVEAA